MLIFLLDVNKMKTKKKLILSIVLKLDDIKRFLTIKQNYERIAQIPLSNAEIVRFMMLDVEEMNNDK